MRPTNLCFCRIVCASPCIAHRPALPCHPERSEGSAFCFSLRLLKRAVTPEPLKKYSSRTNCLLPRPMASRIVLPSVLPCPVAYDNKIESQIAPLADAQKSPEVCRGKFGVRELALAFIAQRPRRARISSSRLLKPHLKLLTANLELELLASRTKLSSLTFSNRKKIAVFDPAPSPSIGEPKKLSLPLAFGDAHSRRRTAIRRHISNRNSRFTEFRSTRCKHTLYRISNRNKNADFALFDKTNAAHESHAATREPRTTTRAAFRSTIPARPHAYR
jgi:hypothetical protein